MSVAYRKRKKSIRDEKRRLAKIDGLDSFGHIPEKTFHYLQANWYRKITGPPIGTLEDFIGSHS